MPCDYSLELYRSRPAQVEENLTLHRFPSGTMGMTDGKDNETAVCAIPGTTMVLSDINEATQKLFGIGPIEEVTFHKNDSTGHAHRDSVIFASNGKEALLQSLNAGIRAQITGMAPELKAPAAAAPVEDPVVAINELIG